MDILAAMTTFVRVADTGSLSAAGRGLNISQPAVSQQILALERHLGVRLVNRTTRKLALTEAGRDYCRHARAIIDAVREADEAVKGLGATLKGHLLVHAPVGFGQLVLADIVIGFGQMHPELTIELILEDRFVDLTEDAVDVAIRLGTLASSGLVATRLGTLRRILVAAPTYLEEFGIPNAPDDLANHRQVRFNRAPDGDAIPLIGPEGSILVPVKPSFLANNAFVLAKALKSGLGLGGAQLFQVRPELRNGSLVRVMPDFKYAPLDVHAVYTSSRFVPAKVRAFVAHVMDAAQDGW